MFLGGRLVWNIRREDDDGDGQADGVNTSQTGDWDNYRNERIDLFDGEGMRQYDFDEKRPWDLPKVTV